jgi:hypothetical protein
MEMFFFDRPGEELRAFRKAMDELVLRAREK